MDELIQRNAHEHLYLSKEGASEVYVNNCHLLRQHQINGLRFLFMQLKKNKPGAIVNFPSHCGKSVTVALFLFAVRNLLEKPVLILCKDENEMFKWKENLLKWTEFNNDDLIIESNKVLKGKKIFIKKIDGLASYLQHSWSIVVIKDDFINKEVTRILDAQYKIWITSTDMKKDLCFMAFIYDWLYPKLKMNVKDFIPMKNNPKEMYLKCIYLDTFLEDFVIREDNIKQFNKNTLTIDFVKQNQNIEKKTKPTRKNKDNTGTKIKRSRRIINDDDFVISTPNIDESVTNNNMINKIVNNTHKVCNINECSNDEVTLSNNKICHSNKHCKQNENNTVTVKAACDITTNMLMDLNGTEQMSFRNAIDDIVKFENNISTEVTDLNDTVANTDKKQGILDNSINICASEKNETKEECKESMENIEMKVVDKTELNKTVKSHKDVDEMLSELEERTLKKFKGSFLDSIF